MEEAADDVAVALTERPLDLAAALVKTAKARAVPSWSPLPALDGELVVTQRVERLLDVAPSRPQQRYYRAWAASVLITTFLLGPLLLSTRPVVAQASLLTMQPRMIRCHTRTQ
jgi:hypothetical protein